MTTHDDQRRGSRRTATLGALAVTVGLLLAAAPASAGHDHHRGRCGSGVCNVGGTCNPHPHARGRARGRQEGHRSGFTGGPAGRAFCGVPGPLRHRAPGFVRGYRARYANAYSAGFQRGRARCGTHRSRPRRWPGR